MTLLAAACASVTAASPSEQLSAPTLSPGNTSQPKVTATAAATMPLVVVSTSIQSSGTGVMSTPAPTTGVENNTASQALPQEGITLADNGKTFTTHTGDRFLLNLGMEVYDWTVNIDNQDVLSRVKNITVIRGAQGLYEALKPGQAILTAGGDPLCRSAKPACMIPSIMYQVTILVQ